MVYRLHFTDEASATDTRRLLTILRKGNRALFRRDEQVSLVGLPSANRNGRGFVATLRISSELTEELRRINYRIYFGFGRTYLSRVRRAATDTRTDGTEAMEEDPQSGAGPSGSGHQKQ